MSAELKYTDRDVREGGQHLYDQVTNFLETYQGDFEFLVDCKMRLASGMDLTVGMTRGVLNCMRANPRYTDELPAPLPAVDMENVVAFKKQKKIKLRYCDKVEYHEAHGSYSFSNNIDPDDPYFHCDGLFEINRPEVIFIPATVKFTYMISRNSNLIHKVGEEAGFQYWPNQHSWGWRQGPRFSVKTACMYPRWINEPIALKPEQASYFVYDDPTELRQYRTWNFNRVPIEFCKRCFD